MENNKQTAKEKAKELVNKFRDYADGIDSETDRFSPNIERKNAKQCALILADEVEKVAYWPTARQYWKEVKEEIEKL